MRVGARSRWTLLWVALLVSAGCLRGCPSEKPPIHLNPNMDNQPKALPQSASNFFADGANMRPEVPGTVARGELPESEEMATGRSPWGFFLPQVPFEVDARLLARGEERFGIYCRPCHGARADGLSPLSRRTGIPIANLHQDRIREMAPGRIFAVITSGSGLMPGYAYPIPVRDRWAIVAFLRKLQKESRH